MVFTIKIKGKPGIESRQESDFIDQALAKLIKIQVNMQIRLDAWIPDPFVEKIKRGFNRFGCEKKEIKNDEMKEKIGEPNSQILNKKNKNFISGYAPAGFS
jgi:hypothetical protein